MFMFTFVMTNDKTMRTQRKLLIEQLDKKLYPFTEAGRIQIPDRGWIRSIRTTLNMTLEQLGHKLNMTKQGAKRIEISEASGTISINLLKEVGTALEMKFIYGFMPINGSVEKYIDKKAKELAERIVRRTNHNMMLEDQATSDESLSKSVQELTADIKQEMRKSLWD